MKYFGWVFLFFTVVYLLPLASRPLCAPDEFQCAATAHEMVVSGKYLLPVESVAPVAGKSQMPLGHWVVSAGIKLFGANSFSVRFPMAIAAGLMALFIWILVKQSTGDEKLAALASTILLCCGAVYLGGTSALPENIGAMLAVGGSGCMFMGFQEKNFNRRKILLIILAGAFAAGAFAAGGLPQVLIMFLPQLVYAILEKRWKDVPFMLLPAFVIAALIVLPWAKKCGMDGEMFWKFFAEIGRDGEVYPWYTVFAVVFAGTFPVALLIPAACFVGRDAWPKLIRQALYRHALVFVAVTILLALLPGMREPRWLIAGFAPMSVLIAAGVREYFNSGGHHRSYNWIMSLWGGALILCGLALVTFAFFPSLLPDVGVVRTLPVSEFFCPVIGFVSICSGGFMLYSLTGNWRGRLYLFFFGLGLLPLCCNWLIVDNASMPEAWYKEVEKEFDTDSDHTVIYTSCAGKYVTAWSMRECKTVSFKDKSAMIAALKSPDRKFAAAVVLSLDEAEGMPAAEKVFATGKLKAFYYPANSK